MSLVGSTDFQDPRQPQPFQDRLGEGAVAVGSSSHTTVLSSFQGVYQYLAIEVQAQTPLLVVVNVAGNYGPNPYGFTRWCVPGSTTTFVIPATGFYATGVQVTVNTLPAVTVSALSYTVYGLRSFPTGLRYDGLYPAQNSQCFAIPYVSGTSAAGPYEPTPSRILVGALVPPACLMSSTTGTGAIYGDIGGTQINLATGAGLAGEYMVWNVGEFGPGLLMDPGQTMAILLPPGISSGSPGALYYDVVT
jgi:hypothetical protein